MVYLLHFEPPYKGIRHYAGATRDSRIFFAPRRSDPRELRVPLIDAALDAGVKVSVARTWSTMYHSVDELPYPNARAKLCPTCAERARTRRRR